MLKTRIIPCLDVKNGRTVKGVQFEDLIDAGDPVSLAAYYNEAGADELCFLDISATGENRSPMIHVINKTARQCNIPLTVGGGVRSLEDISALLGAGADKVSINSAAITNPQLVEDAAYKFGSQCVIIAIDAKDVAPNRFEIFTHGGTRSTGIDAVEWAKKMAELGAGELLVTSMDRDGSKQGYNLPLTKAISEATTIPIIASGGIGLLEHFKDGVRLGKADALLAASVFHFGTFTISQVKQYLHDEGIFVRINNDT